MSPEISGSSTFSQCSLSQMAPVIEASSCIRKRQYVDLAVEIPQPDYSGHTRTPESIHFDVVNAGTRTAAGATVSIDLYHSLQPTSISVEGGSCTVQFEDITCALGDIPGGARRRVRFDVTASAPGSTSSTIAVAVDADLDQGNNHGGFAFHVAAATDASIVAEAPQSVTVLSGDEFQISYRLTVTGIAALDEATVRTTAAGLVILSAAPQSGTCTVTSSFATCALGPVAVGSTRRVTLRVRAVSAGDRQVRHDLDANIDDTNSNNITVHNIRVNPLVDLVVEGNASGVLLLKGETFARTFMVRSVGPREAREASFSVRWTNEIVEVIGIDAEDATCTNQAGTSSHVCRFAAAIGSGESRQVDVVFRAANVDRGSITVSVAATDNQHVAGPLSTRLEIPVEARESADVRLEPEFDTSRYENRPFFVNWRMTSIGLTSAQGVRLTMSLPAGFTVLSAETSSGSCTVATSPVRCDFGSLDPDSTAWVSFSVQGDRPGDFVLTAEATATNDADATNNLDTVTITLLPNFDVRVIAPPTPERIKVGNSARYPVEIRSASQPVSNVQVRITSWNLDVDVVSISQGSCVQDGDAIDCALGTLSGNTTVPVELEIQGLEPGSANITVEARGDLDSDPTNDHFGEMLLVAPLGNAHIEISPAFGTPKVGETFESPEVTVQALAETDAVRVRITVPAELSIESVEQGSGPCSIAGGTVDCDFGNLQYADRRNTFMRLRATQAGSFTIAAEVVSLDDSDLSDNSASVTLNVDAAVPPPQPAPPASSGGGGGGSLDWSTLLLGALGLGLRRRRRLPAAVVHARQVHSGRCPDGSAH